MQLNNAKTLRGGRVGLLQNLIENKLVIMVLRGTGGQGILKKDNMNYSSNSGRDRLNSKDNSQRYLWKRPTKYRYGFSTLQKPKEGARSSMKTS